MCELHYSLFEVSIDLHTKFWLNKALQTSIGFDVLIAVAAMLTTNTTYLQHEQGGQGLIAGTNVPN